jgi:aminoglycoside 6'-N-acetyltransferase I
MRGCTIARAESSDLAMPNAEQRARFLEGTQTRIPEETSRVTRVRGLTLRDLDLFGSRAALPLSGIEGAAARCYGRRMDSFGVRPLRHGDEAGLMELRAALWTEMTAAENECDVAAILAGTLSSLPMTAFVAEADASQPLIGFVEVGLRSHANGCDRTRTVGFIEGWFVAADWRGRGVGRALIEVAEAWAKERGCREMASDTGLTNERSQRAHEALGFQVVDRAVNYKKSLI